MDQVALRLEEASDWTYLGGNAEAKKPLEVVVRAFEGAVLFATGSGPERPDGYEGHFICTRKPPSKRNPVASDRYAD